MSHPNHNLRRLALACIVLLLGGTLFDTFGRDVQRISNAQEMHAGSPVPAGCALINRGGCAEMQSLRSPSFTFFVFEPPTSQPGNGWSLLSCDARPSGTPTLQSQAVRLQI